MITDGSKVDMVHGGSGNDVIMIKDSTVKCVDGGKGDDTIIVDPGDKYFQCVIDGGSGNDTLIYKVGSGGGRVVFRGGKGCDRLCVDGSEHKNFVVQTRRGRIVYKSSGYGDASSKTTRFIVKDVEILSVSESDVVKKFRIDRR